MSYRMEGFEHRDGNMVSFKGALGKVELTFHRPSKESEWDFGGPELNRDIPSYFSAAIIDEHDRLVISADGISAEDALILAYTQFATFRALEDMGEL